MKKYVLDTNLYIEAIRNPGAAEELHAFHSVFLPVTYLSSVVLHELLVGASSPAKSRDIKQDIASPFERTRRIVTPSAEAWIVAGDAIAAMAKREKRELRTLPKSLMNDYLLAASCRESGVILVTRNVADFDSIARYIPAQFVAPWPE